MSANSIFFFFSTVNPQSANFLFFIYFLVEYARYKFPDFNGARQHSISCDPFFRLHTYLSAYFHRLDFIYTVPYIYSLLPYYYVPHRSILIRRKTKQTESMKGIHKKSCFSILALCSCAMCHTYCLNHMKSVLFHNHYDFIHTIYPFRNTIFIQSLYFLSFIPYRLSKA